MLLDDLIVQSVVAPLTLLSDVAHNIIFPATIMLNLNGWPTSGFLNGRINQAVLALLYFQALKDDHAC